MSLKVLRPCVRSFGFGNTSYTPLSAVHRQSARQFLTGATSPQTLSVARTLPYAGIDIYNIIADIESYPKFVPYCDSASVTSWSKKDAHYQRAWPQRATLSVGYRDKFTESFTSSIFCVPPVSEKGRAGVGYVEATSGNGSHQMQEEHIEHHDHESDKPEVSHQDNSPIESLKTRWTIRSFPFAIPSGGSHAQDGDGETAAAATEKTDVTLSIEYKFKNSIYDMMSKAVAPKVAESMIEAFEKRVRSLLEK